MSFLRVVNKAKPHISEKVPHVTLEFNKEIGSLVAEQYADFSHLPSERPSPLEIMKYCCQFSAIFGEFNKVLFDKTAHGSMFIGFVNRGGLTHVQNLVRWILQSQYQLEAEKAQLSLVLCRHI